MADDGVVDKVAARLTMDITPAQQALLTLGADYQKFNQQLLSSDKSGMGQVVLSNEEQQARLQQLTKDGNASRLMLMANFYQESENQQKLFDQKYIQNEQMNQERLVQLQEQGQSKLQKMNLGSGSSTHSGGFNISAGQMAKDMLMWGTFSTIFQNVQEGLVTISKDAAGLQQVFHGNIQTQDQLNQVTNKFIDIAKQYGASVDEVMQSGKLWGRQYSEQIAEVLTGNSTLLSIVDNLSVTDANKAVESSMQALGLQVTNVNDAMTNSMKIIDSWTAVSHGTSASTKDISDGFERAAASAKQVGINVDQLSALVAAGVRNSGRTGTVVGNMWKSVMDNIATGSTKVQDAFQALGIQMFTVGANGQKTMKPIWDLLMQLSQASQTATVSQTKYFSAIAGGKYQFDTLRASVTDLTTIQNAYNESLKSAGTTQEKAQAQMHTLAAELTRLKDTIQQMSYNAESGTLGDVLKGLVVGLTDLIQGFQKLPAGVDYGLLALGGLLIAGKALSGMMTTLTSTFKLLGAGVSFWLNPVKSLSGAMTELATTVGVKNTVVRASAVADAEQAASATLATAAITAEGRAAAVATPEFAMLDAVTGGLAIVIGAAITGVALYTSHLGAMSNATDNATQSAQQFNQQLQQETTQEQANSSQIAQNVNQLQSLKSGYEQAAKALSDAKVGTDAYKQAQAQLLDIKSQMITILGKEATDQILNSKSVVKSFNDEVQAMLDARVVELQAVNDRLKNEQLLTDGTVQQSNKRIEAYQNEINAINQAAQVQGSRAFDTQGAMSPQISVDDQAKMDALAAQQDDIWQRQTRYKIGSNRYSQGPIGDAVASAQADAAAHRNNPNIVLHTTSGGVSSGVWPSNTGGSSGAGGSAATKQATDALRSYNEQLKLTSDNMSMYDTTLSKTLTDLHSHITSTQDVTTATKAYDNEVQSIKAHQAALTAENEKIKQLLPTIPKLSSEYQTLTDTLANNTKAMAADSQKLADIRSQVTSEITNMLQTAYADQQKLQEDALKNQYQPQIDALTEQKNAVDALIQSQQQEYAIQDAQTKLSQDQLSLQQTIADKRFEIVGLDGKLTRTYDTNKAEQLQDQITKDQRDIQKTQLEQQKSALEQQIKQLTDAYTEQKQQLSDYWSYKLQTDQLQQDTDNLILKNGLTGALGYVQTYTSQIIAKYDAMRQAAALAAGTVTQGLSGGGGIPMTGGSSAGGKTYSMADKNGHVDTGSNYDALVNMHNGQWEHGDWIKGHYDSSGHFLQMLNGGMVPSNMGTPGMDSVPTLLAPSEIVVPSWDHLLKGMKQVNNSASTIIHVSGNLEFPNIKGAGDAEAFLADLTEMVGVHRV